MLVSTERVDLHAGIEGCPPFSSKSTDRPKSESLGKPPFNRTFDGLMSRWSTPLEWT